jgi:hypothetical protein
MYSCTIAPKLYNPSIKQPFSNDATSIQLNGITKFNQHLLNHLTTLGNPSNTAVISWLANSVQPTLYLYLAQTFLCMQQAQVFLSPQLIVLQDKLKHWQPSPNLSAWENDRQLANYLELNPLKVKPTLVKFPDGNAIFELSKVTSAKQMHKRPEFILPLAREPQHTTQQPQLMTIATSVKELPRSFKRLVVKHYLLATTQAVEQQPQKWLAIATWFMHRNTNQEQAWEHASEEFRRKKKTKILLLNNQGSVLDHPSEFFNYYYSNFLAKTLVILSVQFPQLNIKPRAIVNTQKELKLLLTQPHEAEFAQQKYLTLAQRIINHHTNCDMTECCAKINLIMYQKEPGLPLISLDFLHTITS